MLMELDLVSDEQLAGASAYQLASIIRRATHAMESRLHKWEQPTITEGDWPFVPGPSTAGETTDVKWVHTC